MSTINPACPKFDSRFKDESEILFSPVRIESSLKEGADDSAGPQYDYDVIFENSERIRMLFDEGFVIPEDFAKAISLTGTKVKDCAMRVIDIQVPRIPTAQT